MSELEFVHKVREGVNVWELKTDQTVPCNKEEKEIYGVDRKIDRSIRRPFIYEATFEDGGTFYKTNASNQFGIYRDFKNLEKAKEYVLAEHEKYLKKDKS